MTKPTMAFPTPRICRTACASFLLLLATATFPAPAGAEEGAAPGGRTSESRSFRFTAEGGQEVVITPEQKARREERRAKRRARHAAEAEARKKAAAAGQPATAGDAAKPAAH